MTKSRKLLAAVVIAMLPATALGGPRVHTNTTFGSGWDHFNGPTTTGQPRVECGEDGADFSPGHAATAPGSAFNEDGTAGTVYAGHQDQNSRNYASSSQYDTACAHGPQ